jgi:ATP-dependent DNA helicase RecG
MNPQSLITAHFRPTGDQLKALEKLKIKTLQDLLLHLPSRYARQGEAKQIADLVVGENAIIYGKVVKTKISKAWKKKIPMSEAVIEDGSGKIKAIWFHQAYMVKKVPEGALAQFSGKVTERNGEKYLANPDIGGSEVVPGNSLFASDEAMNLQAVYPETRGLSSGWLYYHIQTLLGKHIHEQIPDPIPSEMLKKYNLPTLSTALVWIHTPKNGRDAEAARKRFAFQEIFFIQLDRIDKRNRYQSNLSFKVKTSSEDIKTFTDRFPFPLTNAQTKAIANITSDFTKDKPMTRLLEGDVGSGKTAVAAATAFAAVKAGFEVAYMVPTEILARQHFESFIKYFEHMHVAVGLMTGSECRKFPSKIYKEQHTHISRPQLLKWVANGDIPIVIGTHSLIQKSVKFKKLSYVIIDEQHRFGVMQRGKLLKQGGDHSEVPHLLSMTATPIPRTLSLTIYGDLDLTLLDELPAGRKPVITKIIKPDEREKAYEAVRQELKAGRQVYVICPRIDEPDPDKEFALQTKSAKAESLRLKKNVFPEYEIGLVHSKLKPKDKEKVMADFTAGKIDILVSTSVVEVGVNVPNATNIIIEGSERFGLAQLHQLRGRVLRSSHQAYCYLLTETKNEKSLTRLDKLITAKNGFELAEADLMLRGGGTLAGSKQWGLSDLAMDAIRNLKLVEAARTEAEKLLTQDPDLKHYPLLKDRLDTKPIDIHFE